MHPENTPPRRVVVTGIGAVTPLGNSAAATWDALVAGRSGIGPITHFDASGCTNRIAGEVRDYNPTTPVGSFRPRGAAGAEVVAPLNLKEVRKLGRFTHLGLGAGLNAYADSGLDSVRGTLDPNRVGINLGVGLGGMAEIEAARDEFKERGFRRISPFLVLQIAPNILSGQLGILLDFRGPNMCNTAACATSGHSIGEAFNAIRRGDSDVFFAGGSESVVTELAIGAFAQMRATSTRNDAPEAASRPFDRDRDGFIMSEGSVVFVLEEMEHARRRGARIYAEMLGFGASGDAHHLSSLAPGGEGSQRAMQWALGVAGISAERVGYVSAHATSTPAGDVEEAVAIAAIFGRGNKSLHISATKSMTGHLLGAAGAMGALAAVKAISTGIISPTINLENLDPGCVELGLDFTANTAVEKGVDVALANSFGFGGTNASLVFARV
jgi:3-oxoacyl-[acyl-carrier-protein] synthase II